MPQTQKPVQSRAMQEARRQQQAAFLTPAMAPIPRMPCVVCHDATNAGPVCAPCQEAWLVHAYAEIAARDEAEYNGGN